LLRTVRSKQDTIRGGFLDSESIEVPRKHCPGGKVTNNQAEYYGLIRGLQGAARHGIKRLEVKGDSNVVIQQMKGTFHVKSPNITNFFRFAKENEHAGQFSTIQYEYIPRAQNEQADALAKAAVKKRSPSTH
jgi:ribonuclease HI